MGEIRKKKVMPSTHVDDDHLWLFSGGSAAHEMGWFATKTHTVCGFRELSRDIALYGV
jgi:hypothetical protein